MKNLMFILTVLILFLVVPAQAQELRILKADTLSNSTTHTFQMYLGRIGTLDSIVVSVYASGELDTDTMYIHGGLKRSDIPYIGSTADIDGGYELVEGADLTIDVADDRT